MLVQIYTKVELNLNEFSQNSSQSQGDFLFEKKKEKSFAEEILLSILFYL
jgi:hypothetical protein